MCSYLIILSKGSVINRKVDCGLKTVKRETERPLKLKILRRTVIIYKNGTSLTDTRHLPESVITLLCTKSVIANFTSEYHLHYTTFMSFSSFTSTLKLKTQSQLTQSPFRHGRKWESW